MSASRQFLKWRNTTLRNQFLPPSPLQFFVQFLSCLTLFRLSWRVDWRVHEFQINFIQCSHALRTVILLLRKVISKRFNQFLQKVLTGTYQSIIPYWSAVYWSIIPYCTVSVNKFYWLVPQKRKLDFFSFYLLYGMPAPSAESQHPEAWPARI